VKKIKNNTENENLSGNIHGIATDNDVLNILQTYSETNNTNELSENNSLGIGLFLILMTEKIRFFKNPWIPFKNYKFPIESQRRLTF
jgi:hypothetical protein